MKNSFKEEKGKIISEFKKLDRKIVVVFLSVILLETFSWYFTSRRFFNLSLYDYFKNCENVSLIEFYYWYIGDFISLFLFPLIVIKFILKNRISDYGLVAGDKQLGLRISLVFFLVMLPFLWLSTSFSSFENTYPLMSSARESWVLFILYEAGLFLYIFAWEFIWRGFLLFGLKEKFGYYAIFIQTIPFVILHNGKPVAETLGAIAAGIALGALALRTGSIYYGVIIHTAVMFSIDLISVLRYKAGAYGIGTNSFMKILNNL